MFMCVCCFFPIYGSITPWHKWFMLGIIWKCWLQHGPSIDCEVLTEDQGVGFIWENAKGAVWLRCFVFLLIKLNPQSSPLLILLFLTAATSDVTVCAIYRKSSFSAGSGAQLSTVWIKPHFVALTGLTGIWAGFQKKLLCLRIKASFLYDLTAHLKVFSFTLLLLHFIYAFSFCNVTLPTLGFFIAGLPLLWKKGLWDVFKACL